jgi:opacity protein-like surface antigen
MSIAWVSAGPSAIALCVSMSCAAAAGLNANPDSIPWAKWQGRLAFDVSPAALRSDLSIADGSGLKVSSASLVGDYYFTRTLAPTGVAGGFRATSGLLYGARPTLWSVQSVGTTRAAFVTERRNFGSARAPGTPDQAADASTLPYLGIGYTGLSVRGGWSFSADIGLVAQNPSSGVKLGRVFNGNQNLDDLIREMRLSPVVQLGVSYAF